MRRILETLMTFRRRARSGLTLSPELFRAGPEGARRRRAAILLAGVSR